MPCIQGEIIIQRPAEEVFDFVADEHNEPRYNPRMVSDRTSGRRRGRAAARFSSAE